MTFPNIPRRNPGFVGDVEGLAIIGLLVIGGLFFYRNQKAVADAVSNATTGCPSGYEQAPDNNPLQRIFGGGMCIPTSGPFANDNGQIGFTTGGSWG